MSSAPSWCLSASHVPIAVALVLAGLALGVAAPPGQALAGAGAGMTLYGALDLVFHDGMVHGRLPVAWLVGLRVCRRWKAAHELHRQSGHRGPWGFFT